MGWDKVLDMCLSKDPILYERERNAMRVDITEMSGKSGYLNEELKSWNEVLLKLKKKEEGQIAKPSLPLHYHPA